MERLDDFKSAGQGRSLDDILTNGYSLDAMAAISRGFNILGRDIGSYLGFFVLSFIISFVMGLIPVLSIIVGLIVSPALNAGYSYYLKGYLKDDTSEFSNFFNGFKSPQIWQLFLAHLISQLIIGAVALVLIIIICGTTIMQYADELISLSNPANISKNQEIAETLMASGLVVGILISVLIALCLALFWILASQFVVFRELTFWDALEASRKIVMKKFFSYLGWAIVWLIIILVSALPCGLGLLFTIPAFMLSTYALYMQVTGDEEVLNQ